MIGVIIAVAVIVGAFYALSSCSSSGDVYYHVPGISVEVDKSKKHYKPSAPKPAPKFGSSVGRKR